VATLASPAGEHQLGGRQDAAPTFHLSLSKDPQDRHFEQDFRI
jgi:hypothetical protein